MVTRKNRKHIQTDAAPRKAKVEPSDDLAAAAERSCSTVVANTRRRASSSASASSATEAAANAATRHPKDAAMPVMNTGPAAQPRFPERLWTENAWPSLGTETSRLSVVKSAGWKTLLPVPASKAAASNIP